MRRRVLLAAALILTLAACSIDDFHAPAVRAVAIAQIVARADIVSDQGGATALDPQLINAWGLAFNPLGFAWVSATGSGLSAVYTADGAHAIPSVTIPEPPCATDEHSSPTGQVFNGAAGAFLGDAFIFVTEQGSLAGWQTTFGSEAKVRGPSACAGSYTGVTIANGSDGQPRLYAANFNAGTIDVFDAAYAPIMAGRFVDAAVPSGFAPFNIELVNGNLVVTYAKQDADKKDEVSGPGNGYVDLFDTDGNLMARLASAGELNSPWGVTMTPASFGAIPNRLLIGNFGDGVIHVYALDPTAGLARIQLEGALGQTDGNPMVIDGLRALHFGIDAGGFGSDTLYFTAGPAEETHGVFGRLTPAVVGTELPIPPISL